MPPTLNWDRELTDAARRRLDAAFRALARRCGGVEAAGEVSNRDKAQISRYGSPNTEQHAPIDVVATLELIAGPLVTRELAALSGHVLVPAPPATGDPAWLGHLARVSKETSDVIGRIAQALNGETKAAVSGQITAEEIAELNLIEEAREAIECLTELKLALEAKALNEGTA